MQDTYQKIFYLISYNLVVSNKIHLTQSSVINFVPFLIKKRHFSQVFVQHILIFKKLHLLLLSKMKVQAENGAKTLTYTFSDTCQPTGCTF